jgi:hypothetical protein
MATEWKWVCAINKNHKNAVGRLYDDLKKIAKNHNDNKAIPCRERECTGKLELNIKFDFKFGAEQGERECVVIDVFLPEISHWSHNGKQIKHRPFIVKVVSKKGITSVWLPYWHVEGNILTDNETNTKAKYGQWAPFIDNDTLKKMIKEIHL